MTSFTVTTTWGSKHWDVYGRRCIESIEKHWPQEVKKIYYPDDVAQSLEAPALAAEYKTKLERVRWPLLIIIIALKMKGDINP